MISQQSRHCTVELQALPSRIGQVRRIVSAQLRYWHLDPLIERAALGVTELLSNVHRHAEPDKICTVEMELLLGRLTVSVHDNDPRLPVVQDAEPFATCGRGLAMVAAVSESWGVRPHGESGKVVWFTLPASSAAVPKISPYVAGLTVEAAQPCDTGQPYDTGRRPAARGRRSEHAPARSAVAG
ncbi:MULTISPECIES: ATP-binding protein [Streptomyces]|uniref:Anti-sigma regulatory factor (Ser/Thr protein kinase) n=1 Tax=Streptomyces stelliscabiei TaxID=146820 RepID=A0A8I0TMV5_9ACTN|nr:MULTISPECIES: ATP-binding protein [Streptomyces]MBE1595040.1 anti-sigma regulatory factor (Ser/Thr protein kinase) [Streptomyces stelliscabiei]MDX2516009.1 ATP-binding protein [Streptomyces stelliscabiei]MDX2552982.1 ATP-binding protein [Streptomyces stelliscabiei]MDX2611970.1 ATP-binding protein [Streptomyces stelliscabiei]MDX2636308.1 ATP-binding protein [Streptomyces stelliscabiei]